MASNWTILHIAEQVALASRRSKEVEDTVDAPDSTLQAAGLLLADIEHHALVHERLLTQLRNEMSPLNPLLEIAEKIALHWANLSAVMVCKVGELQAEAKVISFPRSRPMTRSP
jgi:hypothetical protein